MLGFRNQIEFVVCIFAIATVLAIAIFCSVKLSTVQYITAHVLV